MYFQVPANNKTESFHFVIYLSFIMPRQSSKLQKLQQVIAILQ